jgi:hypothetical protein
MKHKILCRLAAIVLLLLCTLTAVSCSSDEVEIPDGMQLATTAPEYYFFVPTSWIVNTGSGTSSAYYSMDDMTTVSISVTSYSPTESLDIDGYWDMCEEEYRAEFKNYSFISKENTTVSSANGAKNAIAFTYTADFSGKTYKFTQIIFTNGDMFYTMTYTALSDQYDAHLEDLSKMKSEFVLR